jgi:hypothetical protein
MTFDRNALLAAALLLGVFACGAVVGGVAVAVVGRDDRGPPHGPHGDHGPPHGPPHGDHGPPGRGPPHGPPHGPPGRGPPPERVVDELRRAVDLDDDQARAVRAIVDDTGVVVDRAFADGEQRMRALLRPEQLPRFDAFFRRERRDGPPEGPRDDDGDRGPPPR